MENRMANILHGKPVPPLMLGNLNAKIREKNSSSSVLNLIEATATVFGTSVEDAYLSVEMLMKEHEMSPCFMTIALPGSKVCYPFTISKGLASLDHSSFKTIRDYWSDIAKTLTFRGTGMSIMDSQR